VPIYEYKCEACAAPFEMVRPIEHIDEPATCPGCGVRDFHERKVTNCHFQFADGMPSYQDSPEILDESEFNDSFEGL